MLEQYIFYNSQEKWKEKNALVEQTVDLSNKLFDSYWLVGSVWDCVDTLREALHLMKPEEADEKITEAYQVAILDQIDNRIWHAFNDKLSALTGLINNEATNSTDVLIKEGWLGLDEKGLLLLKNKLGNVPNSRLSTMLDELEELYKNFANDFKPIAAALSLFMPDRRIDSVAHLKKEIEVLMAGGGLEKGERIEVWEGIFRYIGQSVFSFDIGVREWAIDFLATSPLDSQVFEDKKVTTLLLICFYIVARDFKDLFEEERFMILSEWLWLILSFGVPLRIAIEDELSNQQNVLYYEFYSGQYAQLMSKSDSLIYFNDSSETVASFLQKYHVFAKGGELDGFRQINFIDEFLKDRKWPATLKKGLLELLYIFLHLREMDLVDYRGILSDSDLRPPVYDWKKIIQINLDDEKTEEIKRYFSLLKRPTKFKIELITAFQGLNWQTEPYLYRVLILNDIFQDVYPHYPNLVYFDEEMDEFKINKEIPSDWVRYSFAFDYKQLIDKTIEDNQKNQVN